MTARLELRAPDGTRAIDADDGETLFAAAGRAGVAVDTSCGGKGTCGLCRVRVLAGGEHLTPYTDEERLHLGTLHHLTKLRLACRTRVQGDAAAVVVEVVRRRTRR